MTILLNISCLIVYFIVALEVPLRLGFLPHQSCISFLSASNCNGLIEVLILLGFSVLMLPILLRLLRNIDFDYRLNPISIKAAFCIAGVLLLAHWVACGWIALRPEVTEEPMEAYVKALYWAVASLTTVGYGDIVPQTIGQYAYAILVMLIGIAMYASIIGFIANIISKRDHARSEHQERLDKLRSYLQYHQVPLALRKRIWKYYNYLWSNKLSSAQFNMLAEIPEPIKTEVALFLVGDLLKSSDVFMHASSELVSYLAPKLKFRLSMPSEHIVKEGAAAEEMYFISKGEVEVIKGGELITKLNAGDHFGEMALLSERTVRNASVVARTVVEHYALDQKSFMDALVLFPEFKLQIKQAVEQRLTKKAHEG